MIRKNKDKIIAIVFAVVMVVLFSLPSRAETPTHGTCGDRAAWSYKNNTLTIYGFGDMYDYPPYDVPWAAYRDDIHTVVVCGCITRIGDSAFYNCTALKDVYMGYAVKSIGYYGFKNCTSLKYIQIPFGVTEIGWSAFENCTSLKTVAIPNTVNKIGDWAFAGCTSLVGITLPISIKTIGNYAFNDISSTIYYMGNDYFWSKVDTGYYNEWSKNVKIMWK